MPGGDQGCAVVNQPRVRDVVRARTTCQVTCVDMDTTAETRASTLAGVSPALAGYPKEAVEWVVGRDPARLLEISAGGGALTSALCTLGHDVVATDSSLDRAVFLRRNLPQARVVVARAEDIPLGPSSVDVVAVGPGYVSLDIARAHPEIARVLGSGGVLALIWNRGDAKVPWVRKLFALMGVDLSSSGGEPFEWSDVLTISQHRSFRHWQRFERHHLVNFVASSARVASLSSDEREDLLTEAGELYDSYGRGPDGLLMPWLVDCYRIRVKGTAHVVTTGPPDDGLLIDFS